MNYSLDRYKHLRIPKDRMELIQEALEITPDYALRLSIKGWGYYKQDKLEEAIQLLRLAKENCLSVNPFLEKDIQEVEQALAKQKSEQ